MHHTSSYKRAIDCVDSAGRWITSNRLKLNKKETEGLLVGSGKKVSVSQDNHLRVGNRDILKSHVENLGVYIDAAVCAEAY